VSKKRYTYPWELKEVYIETFTKPNNTAIPISSRRYLLAYEHVVKYLGFAREDANSYKPRGINTKYLTTAEFIVISL
jgi:hypothetical protein